MASIRDVAAKAGVSRTTVSIVLNNGRGVSDPVRSRVLRAARELDYVPSRAARAVASGKTHTLGVLVLREEHQEGDPYSTESTVDSLSSDIISGIEDEIGQTTYRLTFEVSDGQVSGGLPRMVRANETDGLIVIGGSYEREFLGMISNVGVPSVLTGSLYAGERMGYVFVDTRTGMMTAVDHLLTLGHRRIGLINSTDQSTNSADKRSGYLDAFASAEMDVDEGIIAAAPFTAAGGYAAMERLWKAKPRPTAVVTAFDGIAVGVLRFAHAHGIRVPGQLSVIGFEDGWLASHSCPALTTVRIPKRKIGRLAVRHVRDMIDGALSGSFRFLMEPELIVRESTGAPEP